MYHFNACIHISSKYINSNITTHAVYKNLNVLWIKSVKVC